MNDDSPDAHPPRGTTLTETVDEVFSDYVALLGQGEQPDLSSYEAVCEDLRGLLVREMHRRGLWNVPPAFLGCTGARWSDGALDEIVTDAYTFVFIDRQASLISQQRQKMNIRPMVVLNVRHFLTGLQKKADPLGYRLFGRLRDAVKIGIREERLSVLHNGTRVENGTRLKNNTVLTFRPPPVSLTSSADLAETIRRWNDELLPKLVTAEGPAVPKVVERLSENVLALAEAGVAAFRFGDLIGELKADVRRRWRAIWEASLGELGTEYDEGETPRPVPFAEPDDEPDWPERLLLIQDCVETSIERERAPKGRRDLRSLWFWLRAERLDAGEYGVLPKFTELGRHLQLTRDRVRQLFEWLRPIVDACLKTAGTESAAQPGTVDGRRKS